MCKKSLNRIRDYVPRHFRLGSPLPECHIVCFQEMQSEIPIVGDDGVVVRTDTVVKKVPAVQSMAKYRCSAFRLDALIQAGVPLKVVNINPSKHLDIENLANICSSIDNAERFVQKVVEQQKERESWFIDSSKESHDVELKN